MISDKLCHLFLLIKKIKNIYVSNKLNIFNLNKIKIHIVLQWPN